MSRSSTPLSEARRTLMDNAVRALLRTDLETATRLFTEALQCIDDKEALANPDIGEIMIHLANIATQEGRLREAIGLFKLSAFVYSHCTGFAQNRVLALQSAAHLSRTQGRFGECHQILDMIAMRDKKNPPSKVVQISAPVTLAIVGF